MDRFDAPSPGAPMAAPLPGSSPSDVAANGNLKQLIDNLGTEQRQLWLRGHRPRIESYFKDYPALRDHADVFTLIYNEFLLREEIGEAPREEEYAQRFPQFADQLREQLRLHQLFASWTFKGGKHQQNLSL